MKKEFGAIKVSCNWQIEDSVKTWLTRNLNLDKRGRKQSLIDHEGIDESTLYKMIKEDLYFFSTENRRNEFATLSLLDDIKGHLGLYGYPSNQNINSKINSETINNDKEANTLFEERKNILLERKKSDLKKIASNIPLSSGRCFFEHRCCQFIRDKKKQVETDGVSFYLTSHAQKLFGAFRPTRSKRFEAKFFVCTKCLNEYSDIFAKDISKIIKETAEKYRFKQSDLAKRLEVYQGYISKIYNDKVNFLKPELVKNIYRLWLKGTLKDAPLIAEHYQDYMGLMVRFVVGELDEQELLLELGVEEALNYAMDYEDLSIGQDDGDAVTITEISLHPCDCEFSTNDIKISIHVEGTVEKDSGYPYFENEGYKVNADFKVTLIDFYDDTFWEFEPIPE